MSQCIDMWPWNELHVGTFLIRFRPHRVGIFQFPSFRICVLTRHGGGSTPQLNYVQNNVCVQECGTRVQSNQYFKELRGCQDLEGLVHNVPAGSCNFTRFHFHHDKGPNIDRYFLLLEI